MLRVGKQNSLTYSQNFLKSSRLVKHLLQESGILPTDLVVEIGAGHGEITLELAKVAGRVIAYEPDPTLYTFLKKELQKDSNVTLIPKDFLKANLPDKEYKVFANIPFSKSAQIIDKLTNTKNPPVSSHLIIQREAAYKLLGLPKETQVSLLLKNLFAMKINYAFNSSDFEPSPKVTAVMLEIIKKHTPDVEDNNTYQDFISFVKSRENPSLSKTLRTVFTNMQTKLIEKELKGITKTSQLSYSQWLFLFKTFERYEDGKHSRQIKGYFGKSKLQQEHIKKIHRTRLDSNWFRG
ncbi:MAG: rRNA adenine dimethyltransferase family protein [Patescibacteria group bacterium]